MPRTAKGRIKDAMNDDLPVDDHLEKDVTSECAYCGQRFAEGEVVIEKELHGRKWRFCCEEHYEDFLDAIDFRDEDLDGYEPGEVIVGRDEEE